MSEFDIPVYQETLDGDKENNVYSSNVEIVPEKVKNKITSNPAEVTEMNDKSNFDASNIGQKVVHPKRLQERNTIKTHNPLKSEESTSSKCLTSEEREFLEVQRQIKAEENRMKSVQKNFQRNKALGIKMPCSTIVRSVKPLTVPTTPFSHVAVRKGKKELSGIAKNIFVEKEKEKITNVPSKKPTVTQIKPFRFRTKDRALSKGEPEMISSESVLTAAELIERFQRDPRSHDVPKVSGVLTLPKSPLLLTSAREKATRRPPPPSSQELKDAQDAEALKYVFRARPLDPKIFQGGGEAGVPKVTAKTATEPCPFHLHTEDRSVVRRSIATSESSNHSVAFKARPMPQFSSTQQAIEKKRATIIFHPTIPVSPNLSRPRRSASAPPRRPHPLAGTRHPQRAESPPSHRPLTLTEPKEFHLRTAERGLQHQAVLIRRLQQQEMALSKAREVHAMPVPQLSKPFVPRRSSKDLTEFEEFDLQSVMRHQAASAAFREAICSEERRRRAESGCFRARQPPETTYVAFAPKVEEHEPIVAMPIELQTDKRAVERKEFDAKVALRKSQEEREQQERERLAEEEEERRLRELRAKPCSEGGMTFVASKVLESDPYPVKHVIPPPLTEPHTPKLLTSQRARAHRGE